LIAARLAADVCGVPSFVLARTDAESAKLITADVDERDREFITGERTPEGFYRLKPAPALPLHQARYFIREICRPDLVRPRRRTSTRPGNSPRRCTRSIRTRCWL